MGFFYYYDNLILLFWPLTNSLLFGHTYLSRTISLHLNILDTLTTSSSSNYYYSGPLTDLVKCIHFDPFAGLKLYILPFLLAYGCSIDLLIRTIWLSINLLCHSIIIIYWDIDLLEDLHTEYYIQSLDINRGTSFS